MGNRRRISADVKMAAIRLYENSTLPLPFILYCVGFSRSTFFDTLKLWRTTGMVVKPRSHKLGRHRLLLRSDLDYILSLIRFNPTYFLDELLDLLETNRFISVHYITIHRELERAGVSRKRLRKIARERNEELRADFVRRMAAYSPEQLGFIDKTSKDERTCGGRFGRAIRGHRAVFEDVFVRGIRLSGTGLMTIDGMASTCVTPGSMTREKLMRWLQDDVVPLTSPFPGPLSVLILDNARIHHGQEVYDLADAHGIRLEYLPPYSPDLNPIEEAFSQIKAFIRRNQDIMQGSETSIYDLHVALDVVTGDDAEEYIRHAGYM